MYAEVAWVLVSSGTQVQPQIILDPNYLPDYLSVSYDYGVKEGKIFLFVFVFWENLFCTTFYFDFLKFGIAPLMLKTILNTLFSFVFNFKIQIPIYILIDGTVTNFLKRFIFCYIILTALIALGQE